MRWLRQSIVVLGALALIAAGPVSAGGDAIPRGAHVLEVTVRRPHRAPLSDVTVTSAAKVRHFASLIDALKAVGPTAEDCAGKIDDPVVTFTFRAAPGARVLARARQLVVPGAHGGFCEAMTLVVDGHPQTPRLGGARVVRAAQRLLGIRVPRP